MTTATWALGFIGLAITNFLSVFVAVGTMKWLDSRKKRKFAEMVITELGERISTEVNFQDIVSRFEQDEKKDDK